MIVNSFLQFSSEVPLLVTSDEKLAVKAANSLPEFFQEEFPTFQKFVDIYYQYTGQARDGYKKMETVKDIDEVGAKYLAEFYKVYANRMPVFPYMGMADFVRNAKKFYVSRGSEDSYRFLFRIMFGSEIEFKYPKENIFRPSSGEWSQKISVYLKVASGVVNDSLIGKKLLVRAADGSTIALVAKSYQLIPNIVSTMGGVWDDNSYWFDSEIWLDTVNPNLGTVYEIEVDKFVSQTVVAGAKVFANQNPTTLVYDLEGEITTTLNQYRVVDPGEDFRLGEIHSFVGPSGLVSYRITALTNEKGIKRIEFLSFPSMYTGATFSHNVSDAVLEFYPGAVNRYSGYYTNSDGFLSNNTKLQDSYFYQIFSYVIKSRVSRDAYEDIANQILHPAGLIMFSEYEKMSINPLSVATSSYASPALDMLDVVNVYDQFERVFDAIRGISDTVLMTDTVQLNVGKTFNDTVAITDSGSVQYWAAGEYSEVGYHVDNFYTTANYLSYAI